MTYTFTIKHTIEITGEVEADSRTQAEGIVENILANDGKEPNSIVFTQPSAVDYMEIEPENLPDVFEIYNNDDDDDF